MLFIVGVCFAVTEGLTLIKDGHSPYEGDTCHEVGCLCLEPVVYLSRALFFI